MTIQLGWTAVGVILAILVHAFFTVWWAAKITNQMENLGNSLNRLDKELEKRDAQISAIWKRVDEHSERISSIEGKI